MSTDSKKKCVVIHQQARDSKMSSHLSGKFETKENEIKRIVSKASVTLSWRESCILTGTPLYELNPSLMKQSSDTTDAIDREKENTAANSPADDHGSTDTEVTFGQLAEWLRQNIGTEEEGQEDGITSEISIDIMSEHSSDDLLSIWFKADDSATQKVYSYLEITVL